MFKSKDGTKSFMSGFRAHRYDKEHETPQAKKVAGPKDTTMSAETPKPHEVVAEHGKATDIHITHDHEAGKHHVTSIHEDGHMNESDHDSADEAHEHAKELAGDANETEATHGTDEQGSTSAVDSLEDWA